MIHLRDFDDGVLDGLLALADEGSHAEGILVLTPAGKYQAVEATSFGGAAATVHIHGGTCARGDVTCFLEPPSVKDLRAFNSLFDRGVRLHFIVGVGYVYRVRLKRRLPAEAFLPFEALLGHAEELRGHFTAVWDRLYERNLTPYMDVVRFEVK